MTVAVKNLINSFNTLSDSEKHDVAVEILREQELRMRMEAVVFLGFIASILVCTWMIVRFVRRIQDKSDRRYPESTNDGTGMGDGGTSSL